jgi:hypothetical protein
MIVVRTAESAEQALTEGQMLCPRRGCGDTLSRWDTAGAGISVPSVRR